jgi:hypothetical protein
MREESVSDPICSAEKRWAGIAPQVMQKVISDEIKDFVRDNNKNIDHQQDMLYTEEDKCGSLAAGTHGSAGHLHNIIIPMQDDGTTSMTKHGPGWHEENVGYTVNTVDRQSVAYGIDMQGGKGNANYKENKSPTLCSDSHGTPHGVAYGIGRDAFNMGENAQFGMSIEENTQPPITAKGAGGVCTNGVSYQKTTGPLMASGYQKNGTQEAANDMYVVEPKTFSMQAIGEYKQSDKGSSLKQRDYKDHTDLIVAKGPGDIN